MRNTNSINHSQMREMNLALLLNTLRVKSPISRTGLSRSAGLNKATVSSMVRELVDQGIVLETGELVAPGEIGRPAISLKLNPDAGFIVAAEIGVDFISVIGTDFTARIIDRKYKVTGPRDGEEVIIASLFAILREMCDQFKSDGRAIFGLALGVPGLVDSSSGTLVFAPNLGWRDVKLRQMLEQELGVPVYVDNEANMATLGEVYFGAGRESDLVLYVSSGVGVGGGIVLDGLLFPGCSGFAAEIGHMRVDPNGIACGCGGMGCWETVASQQALFRRIRTAIETGSKSSLEDVVKSDASALTVQRVLEAAQSKDRVAIDALGETGRWLGVGIGNLINVLNPCRVVLGGILSIAAEFILPEARRTLAEVALPSLRETCLLVIADHGADACVMGGIATVYHKILTKPFMLL